MNKISGEKNLHKIYGFSLVVVSPYEEPHIYSHRGEDAGEVFIEKNQELSDDLYIKIKRAETKMMYTAKDKIAYEKATQCHICEEALPMRSTKIDHLEKIGGWLKTMGLPR